MGQVIIIEKDFLYIKYMSFLLGIFNNNPDQKSMKITNKIISDYIYNKEISGLIIIQKNKINIILIIQDFKYIIILIYHYNILNNINSNKNYNSDNNPDYLSSSSNDTEYDSNKDKNNLLLLIKIVSGTVNIPRIIEAVIRNIINTNPVVSQFLAGYYQKNQNNIRERQRIDRLSSEIGRYFRLDQLLNKLNKLLQKLIILSN